MKAITPNELRLGNLVFDDENSIVQTEHLESEFYNTWNGVDENKIKFTTIDGQVKESEVFGIPLNEEWLIKLGWIKGDGSDYYYLEDKLYLRIDDDKLIYDHPFHPVQIEYVHQLQNLFYILSGTDLNLKE